MERVRRDLDAHLNANAKTNDKIFESLALKATKEDVSKDNLTFLSTQNEIINSIKAIAPEKEDFKKKMNIVEKKIRDMHKILAQREEKQRDE